MRTLTHSCGLPFPLFPLFPLRKHPERLRGGVLRVEVLAPLAGPAPGWSRSRACPPGAGGGGRTALAGYMAGRCQRFQHRQGSEKLQRLPCDVPGTAAFRYQR